MSRMMRRLLPAVLLSLWVGGCRPELKQEPEALRVLVAHPAPVEHPRETPPPSYLATVRADGELDLSFKVAGKVEQIGPNPEQEWREGEWVRQGAVLARLHPGDFTNAVNSAQARAELDRSLVRRNRQLRSQGAVSPQEMEMFEANLRASEAALQQAFQQRADSELLAPASGSILQRLVQAGETVAAGRPVLRFGDLSRVSVELGVPDHAVTRFRLGATVPVRISALEGLTPFSGLVTEVGVAAREGARLFRVVIKVPNPDGKIRPGMVAQVPLQALPEGHSNDVKVPLSALVGVTGEGGRMRLAVFVLDQDRRARLRPIETGDVLESAVVVRGGLTTHDQVVVRGAGGLYDGAWVKVERAEGVGGRG